MPIGASVKINRDCQGPWRDKPLAFGFDQRAPLAVAEALGGVYARPCVGLRGKDIYRTLSRFRQQEAASSRVGRADTRPGLHDSVAANTGSVANQGRNHL